MTSEQRRAQVGFTLVEVTVVVAIALVLGGMTFMQVMPAIRAAKADSALQTTLSQLRGAHQRAVDQHHMYRVTFQAPRTIQLHRVDVDSGGNRTFLFISSISLPREFSFTLVSGVPTGSGLTPDGLGTASSAINLNVDNGGAGTEVFFHPDGRALDSADRLNSGVVYTAVPNDLLSSRAVSVWGATGRIKGWRLGRQSGAAVWRQ